MDTDLKILMATDNMLATQEIQNILEENGIYSLRQSDNPASSALTAFLGSQLNEHILIIVNKEDYTKAVEIINNTTYKDLLYNE